MARILVIDDEANIRKMIRLALQRDGHEVEMAEDGPEGLVKFGGGDGWDVVLLDQRMPGMEGLEALHEMRLRDPDARIIMITAFGTIDLAVDAMKAGATHFLRKPFTLDTLRAAVGAVTAKAPAAPVSAEPTTIGFTTLNGFRIESRSEAGQRIDGELVYHFTVRSPSGEAKACTVILAAYVEELVKAHAACERMPGGDAFWRGFSEEALANHLWQNAQPPADPLRVEELTTGLRRWTDAVLAAKR